MNKRRDALLLIRLESEMIAIGTNATRDQDDADQIAQRETADKKQRQQNWQPR